MVIIFILVFFILDENILLGVSELLILYLC